MHDTKRLAIVGAGVAGLAAAWALRDTDVDVVIFEKSRGLSGRAATRRRHGASYDHGAQYFKTRTDVLKRLVTHHFPQEDLIDIGRAVWTFDRSGTISPGDPAQNADGKWTYRDGISRLGKLLADEAGATIHRQTRVGQANHSARGWHLLDTEGNDLGTFDAVLVTAPASQAFTLIESSALPYEHYQTTCAALRRGTYRAIMALMLAFDKPLERPGDFYALVNPDKDHPISWLAFENDKPGHVPEDQTLLVVHMAPEWSIPRFRHPLEDLTAETLPLVSDLLGVDCSNPIWTDKQGWRFALPDTLVDAEALRPTESIGLFFAGDMLTGGRVHLALESGLEVAERIAS